MFNSTQIVDDSFCKLAETTTTTTTKTSASAANNASYSPPSTFEYCNTDSCPQWSTSAWSSCSSPCGQLGKRSRRVSCMFKSSEVEAAKCVASMGRAPGETEDCRVDCDGEWRASEWSTCSVTCEKGIRTRTVLCERSGKSTGSGGGGQVMKNDESSCDPKLKPTNVTECVVDEVCAKWTISNWSSCIGQCGKSGYRTRTVICSRTNLCDVGSKPTSYENCTVTCARQWRADDWSEVSSFFYFI